MKASQLLLAILLVAAASLASTLYLAHRGVRVHEGHEVRLGVELNTHATAAWIALDKKLFQKHGIHVLDVFRFRTGLELAAAFSHGEIDAAWACLAPVIKMIDKGADIYIVAAAHYYGYGCVGRPGVDSMTKLRELAKGREIRIAVTGFGAQTHILWLLAAKQYGIRDYKLVFIKPPAILSAVLSGSVDAACMPEHYLSIAESKGLPVILLAQDLWPGMPGSYLVVSGRLLHEHPEIVCRLAEVNREATAYAVTHLREAALIDSHELGIPASIAEKSVSRLVLTTTIDAGEAQRLADIMHTYGVIKHHIDVEERIVHIDYVCGHGG